MHLAFNEALDERDVLGGQMTPTLLVKIKMNICWTCVERGARLCKPRSSLSSVVWHCTKPVSDTRLFFVRGWLTGS